MIRTRCLARGVCALAAVLVSTAVSPAASAQDRPGTRIVQGVPPTATDTPTSTPTSVPPTPTDTPTSTPTSVPPTPTDTPTSTPTGGSPTPTATLTPTLTLTAAASPTFTPNGGIPTATPTARGASVPALSTGWQLALVAALAATSLFVLRKY